VAHHDIRLNRVVDFYERLTRADLERLGNVYTADAHFKDPFNEVQGVAAIRAIFQHMFNTLDLPSFVVHEAVLEGDQCFLTWDFSFHRRGSRGDTITVRGASHLRFGTDGLVQAHRDYWDAAEELYEKLPGLGVLMRWLKRRAAG
jgi:ketosteroid isomerase-like protein